MKEVCIYLVFFVVMVLGAAIYNRSQHEKVYVKLIECQDDISKQQEKEKWPK